MEEQASLCDSILEKIDKIVGIPHLSILDAELKRYSEVFTKVRTKQYASYDDFKADINLTKVIHYVNYSKFTLPILTVLSIYLSQLNLLYDYITYYNLINIEYTEEFKKQWFELITEKYTLLSKQFGEALPCMEGYIGELERELVFIQIEPTKPKDMNAKVLLSLDDFTNDGGFDSRRINLLIDWEIIGLTMKTFRVALCGVTSSCDTDFNTIRMAYNLTNYKTYLKYVKFYEKYPALTEEKVLEIIEDAGGIENDSISGKICCKRNILTGGKKTKMHRKLKIKRKTKKNKRKTKT
jgi:hypothetical protein